MSSQCVVHGRAAGQNGSARPIVRSAVRVHTTCQSRGRTAGGRPAKIVGTHEHGPVLRPGRATPRPTPGPGPPAAPAGPDGPAGGREGVPRRLPDPRPGRHADRRGPHPRPGRRPRSRSSRPPVERRPAPPGRDDPGGGLPHRVRRAQPAGRRPPLPVPAGRPVRLGPAGERGPVRPVRRDPHACPRPGVAQACCDLVTAPFEPFDALVCTSRAAVADGPGGDRVVRGLPGRPVRRPARNCGPGWR